MAQNSHIPNIRAVDIKLNKQHGGTCGGCLMANSDPNMKGAKPSVPIFIGITQNVYPAFVKHSKSKIHTVELKHFFQSAAGAVAAHNYKTLIGKDTFYSKGPLLHIQHAVEVAIKVSFHS